MYSIGEISKIVKISVDALRYYDEIGILKPYRIDKSNNYRYYSEEQIKELLFIIEMKQYGFSLDAIKELMHSGDENHLLGACHTRLQQLSKEFEAIEKSITLIKKRITAIERGKEPSYRKKKILIIDDAVFMRQILMQILEQQGYEVAGQGVNGREGIDKYFELKPDIVIMDINMPEMDGITATQRIKEKDSEARIIICTVSGSLSTVLKALKAGADDFITKPFQAENLIEVIEKNIEKSCKYNRETITLLQMSRKLEERFSKGSESQEVINKLLQICTQSYLENEDQILNYLRSSEAL